jgi:hypothetical protein
MHDDFVILSMNFVFGRHFYAVRSLDAYCSKFVTLFQVLLL